MKKSIIQRKKVQPEIKDAKREALEKKVEAGVKKAIDEYREVFKKLAEYDRA